MPQYSISQAAQQLRKEEATRTFLYTHLSPVVGAFDHAEMTAATIAAYGLRKLGLKVPLDDDAKIEAARSWLAGRQAGADIASGRRSALDSGDDFVSRYIGAA